jgi:nucleoside-diphosphate-sugar epimerase
MILITGAGGFLGRRLVPHLVSTGLQVMPLYRASVVKTATDRWEADLTEHDHIAALLKAEDRPTTVIHLAGHVEIKLRRDPGSSLRSIIPGQENLHLLYNENLIATAHLLDFCLHAGVEHLIFASTQAVYGMPSVEVINEDTPCNPLEHYANSKICCERLLEVGSRQGISVTVLRFPGVYSEERREGAIYTFCKTALNSRKIVVTGNIPLPIDVIYIDDVVDSFERAVRYGGDGWRCFNISTGEPCSLDILADTIAELVPGCQVEHSAIQQPVIRMDASRAYTVLGWKAKSRRERLQYIVAELRK